MLKSNQFLYEKAQAVLRSYADVPREEWKKLNEISKIMRLSKGELFLRTGTIPDKIALIVSGIFRVFFISEDGSEKTLAFRDEGRILSGYSGLFRNREARYNIQALENAVLFYTRVNDYQNLINGAECWRIINTKYLELIYSEKEEREKGLLSDNAEIRYKNLLAKFPDIEKRVKQYHIASYLGISPVSLCRIKRMKK